MISNPSVRVFVTYAFILLCGHDPVRHNTVDLRHLGNVVDFLFITNGMIVTYTAIDMEGL